MLYLKYLLLLQTRDTLGKTEQVAQSLDQQNGQLADKLTELDGQLATANTELKEVRMCDDSGQSA